MRKHITSWPLLFLSIPLTQTNASPPPLTKVVIGVDGGTESIRACCFHAHDGSILGKSHSVPYETSHPHPGWAEQNPEDWYENLGAAVRGAVGSLQDGCEIVGICVDTTCCSVVALDRKNQPLRPSLLWMDARSGPQTREILEKCRGDPALRVNSGGNGPVSAEWLLPKALWIRENEPEIWKDAETICEYQDYINLRLTGAMCASSCNAAVRWHWDGEEAISSSAGRPLSLYETLGIPELAGKLPRRCITMGSLVGRLTKEAAEHLGLPPSLPVAQGGPDAFVAMIGLGCIYPGQLCLITGSSHLHCIVSSHSNMTGPNIWGPYKGAPLPHISFAEGGQSSTGSILRWAKNTIFNTDDSYSDLDAQAAAVPPGAQGLVALETFQGSRTPVTDPFARGALLGLTLAHTRAHIWRALLESVCFGTRGCIQGLIDAGHPCTSIIIAGGATRSDLWLQMHADVTGIPVLITENTDAPLLGCAVLASVVANVHGSVRDAVGHMVREKRWVHPDPDRHERYNEIYENVYRRLSPAVRPVVHAISDLRGGATQPTAKAESPVISPSLLASDWSDMRSQIDQCVKANATRLHIDVFDGVFIDSPYALTFGPQMVRAIRNFNGEVGMDVHVCVVRPGRYVHPMAEAGADTFIFQWEAMLGDTSPLDKAKDLANRIKQSGMKCGISINPQTPIEDLFPLLRTGLVDTVDILAVEAGFGGQPFQPLALDKARTLKSFLIQENLEKLEIMMDGGIDGETCRKAVDAGVDVVVAGTFLFRHEGGVVGGVEEIRSV